MCLVVDQQKEDIYYVESVVREAITVMGIWYVIVNLDVRLII